MSSVLGQVFVVTGSASGIGLATTITLLTRGARLGVCDVDQDRLSELVNGLSVDQKKRVISRAVDIADRTAVASFLRLTKEHFGRIDGIANIAGTAGHKLGHHEIWEVDEEEYDFIMDTNVKGIFNILSEALKPGSLQEPGSIVHTASMFGERGFSKGAVYSTSKHAGVGMIKSAAIEGGKRGIRVNTVMP